MAPKPLTGEVYELEVLVPLKVRVQLPTNKLENDFLVDRLVKAITVNLPTCGSDQNPWDFSLWVEKTKRSRGIITEIHHGGERMSQMCRDIMKEAMTHAAREMTKELRDG